jgi:hypothetical protein
MRMVGAGAVVCNEPLDHEGAHRSGGGYVWSGVVVPIGQGVTVHDRALLDDALVIISKHYGHGQPDALVAFLDDFCASGLVVPISEGDG